MSPASQNNHDAPSTVAAGIAAEIHRGVITARRKTNGRSIKKLVAYAVGGGSRAHDVFCGRVCTVTLIAILLWTLLVSACASSSAPAVYGNAKGGAIERFTADMRQIQAIADTHCRKYGKQGRISQSNTEAGGSVFFDCV
jgi:hypothetical protein